MSETLRCTECGYKLEGYAPEETMCGACYSALMYQYEKARAEGREYLDLLPYETDESEVKA